MLFTNKRKDLIPLDIKIDNEKIYEVPKTKFLGIYIDNKLNWKDHISYISGKIARGIGMLIKARKCLDKTTLRNLYYTFIYPYFIYCNQIWGSTYVSNIYKLTILQKKMIRIICQVKPRDHTDPLFKELGIIKVVNIYNYLIGKFMYRWSNNLLPTMFDDLFIYNRDVHHHHTRQYLCLYVPVVKSNLRKMFICYKGAIIWNSLLLSGLSASLTEPVFSSKLKKSILQL